MRTNLTCFILFILSNLIGQFEQSLVSNIFYERDSNDVYFQILSPENLRYTYKAKQAVFGKPFAVNETSRLSLRIIEPNNGCNSIMGSKLELANNVGLIVRGGCSFLDKCIEAERSGLKAILVYDNNVSNDDSYLDMISDNTKRNCSISAAFILGKDGAMIKRQMLYLGLYSVPVQFVNISRLPEEEKINPPWSLY